MKTEIRMISGTPKELQQLLEMARLVNDHHDNMAPFFQVTGESVVKDYQANLFQAAFLFVLNDEEEAVEKEDDDRSPDGMLLFSPLYRLSSDSSTTPQFGVYLDEYFVRSQHRGQGLGTLLMDWLCNWVCSQSSPDGGFITLIHHDQNHLHRHYRRLGFNNLTAPGSRELQFYELCTVKTIDKCLKKYARPFNESKNPVQIAVESVSHSCELVNLSHKQEPSRKFRFLSQIAYTGWMGKVLWLNELQGDGSLLTRDILLHFVLAAKEKFAVPLHCVWLECPKGEIEDQLRRSFMDRLWFDNNTTIEGWHYAVKYPREVRQAAEEYQRKL